MRRPEWAGSRTFAATWNGMLKFLATPSDARRAHLALPLLHTARVIVIPPDQVQVLPGTGSPQEIAGVLAHENLPFDPLFIDLGYLEAKTLPCAQGGFDWGRANESLTLAGLLLSKQHSKLVGVGAMLFAGLAGQRIGTIGSLDGVGQDEEGNYHWRSVRGTHQPLGQSNSFQSGAAIDLAARVLTFLSSINITLVDAPSSRQERRAAERKGGRIAQIVHIRAPRRQREPDTHSKVDWSHRWEVRGHYKTFPKGTRMADAVSDRLSWEPARQEWVRRVWCPPFVKGPVNKPLLPKTHVVVGE